MSGHIWVKARIEALRANKYTAAYLPNEGVVVLVNNRIWKAVGGSAESPTLVLLPNIAPTSINWTAFNG